MAIRSANAAAAAASVARGKRRQGRQGEAAPGREQIPLRTPVRTPVLLGGESRALDAARCQQFPRLAVGTGGALALDVSTTDRDSRQRAVRILARSIYKDLVAQGYDDKQIVGLASELIGEVTTSLATASSGRDALATP